MQLAAWVIAIIIVSLNVKLVFSEITGWIDLAGSQSWIIWITVIPVCAGAAALLLYISFKPLLDRRRREHKTFAPHGSATQLHELGTTVYNKIAIAIDFSSVDALAIRSAITQGGKNAKYLLVHVVETAGAMWYGSQIADNESQEDTQALKSYLVQIQEQGYQVEMKIGFGNPKRVIPEITREFNANLLVMGAHGHNWVKDMVFGTTVDSVRHRIKIPVLIVRGN